MHKPKLICPVCGAEMNHHAMKIDYSVDDGVVQEVHTCPHCGDIELRQAE
jgi:C4-type Zn-finger protein